jgi:hypothetical protein
MGRPAGKSIREGIAIDLAGGRIEPIYAAGQGDVDAALLILCQERLIRV